MQSKILNWAMIACSAACASSLTQLLFPELCRDATGKEDLPPPFPVQAAIAHGQNNTIFRKTLHSLCYIKKDSLFRKVLFYTYDHLLFKKITVFSFFLDITGSHLYIH